jgi:hypothetical protein
MDGFPLPDPNPVPTPDPVPDPVVPPVDDPCANFKTCFEKYIADNFKTDGPLGILNGKMTVLKPESVG